MLKNSPEDLIFIGRGVADTRAVTRNANQFRRLVGDVYPARSPASQTCGRRIAIGALLFLEKYNEADAAAEIARGLAINPNAAELHAARAELALSRFDLAAAKRAIDLVLWKINPELLWAHRAFGRLVSGLTAWTTRSAFCNSAETQSTRLANAGRLLAAYVAADPPGELSPCSAQLIDEATTQNPHCGELFLAAAESFDRMRRFPLAATLSRIGRPSACRSSWPSQGD